MKPSECYTKTPLKELGRGGTAVVYEKYDTQLKINIALKMALESNYENNIDFQALAKREYALIGHFNYPGLVNILKTPDDDYSNLTLELCRGKTLENIGKVDNLQMALNILSAVTINFKYLELNKIIHGDIKPDNIFIPNDYELIKSSSLWYAKLSDFSLGRFENEDENCRAGLGTIGFMAPETIANNNTSYKSDLFALGVIAYQLLSGLHPFINQDETVDPVRINSLIRETDPIDLKELRPELPDELCAIVNQLLEKNIMHRSGSPISICQKLKELGASYPFEKAIQPKHCLPQKYCIEDITTNYFDLNESDKKQILFLSNNEMDGFRLLLSYNFIRQNMKIENSIFVFIDKIYSPPYFIKHALKQFSRLTFSEKKTAIRFSLLKTNLSPLSKNNKELSPLLFDLLPNFLKSKTVIQQSQKLFNQYKSTDDYSTLTRLTLYAGNLNLSEEYCYQAANQLINKNDNKKAHRLLKQVIDFSNISKEQFKTRSLLMLLGDNLKKMGEVAQAETIYHQLIKLYHNKPVDLLLAESYKDLGDIYKMKHNFNDGLKVLNQALEIYQALKNELEISHTYNNLGNIYWLKGDLNFALKNYLQALRIQRKLEADQDVASTLNNIGSIYVIKGRYDRALHIQTLSLNLKKEIGHKGEIARTMNNIGFTYYMTGQYDKAVSILLESLELNKNIGSQKEIMFNLENLSGIMIRAGRIKESIPYLKEGTELARQLEDLPHEGIFCLNTAKVFYYLGRIPDAKEQFEKTKLLNDQIDDFILNSSYFCEMARFHKLYGSKQKAIEYAHEALKSSRKCGDQGILIDSLLILISLEGKQVYIKEASDLIKKSNQSRELLLLKISNMEFMLKNDNSTEELTSIDNNLLNNFTTDIEFSALLYTNGLYCLNNNAVETALTLFEKCRVNSNNIGFKLFLMKSLIRIGEIEFSKEMYEECYEHLQEALLLFRKLSDSMNDSNLKKSFQSISEINILAKKINELKSAIKKG